MLGQLRCDGPATTSAEAARAATWPHIVAGPVPEDLPEAPLLVEGAEVHAHRLPAAQHRRVNMPGQALSHPRVCT